MNQKVNRSTCLIVVLGFHSVFHFDQHFPWMRHLMASLEVRHEAKIKNIILIGGDGKFSFVNVFSIQCGVAFGVRDLQNNIDIYWIEWQKWLLTRRSVRTPGESLSEYSPVTRTSLRISSLRHRLVFGWRWKRNEWARRGKQPIMRMTPARRFEDVIFTTVLCQSTIWFDSLIQISTQDHFFQHSDERIECTEYRQIRFVWFAESLLVSCGTQRSHCDDATKVWLAFRHQPAVDGATS